MGAQTWEDVKDDAIAFCIGAAVVGTVCTAAGLMILWPEFVLRCAGL